MHTHTLMAGKKHKEGKKKAGKAKTPQQRKFAMASKEASRMVHADPRLDFNVQMKKLLKK